MRKSLRIVALVIPMVLVASNSYAAAKAGSTCPKLKMISISKGKIYTCIKSGKKLVWDKGALMTTAQLPSSPEESKSPSPKPTESAPVVIADPIPSAKSIFEDPGICQIKSSLEYEANLGYGVSPTFLKSTGNLNFAIIFTTYTDAPGDDRAFEEYTSVQFPIMAKFLSTASYGKLSISLVTTKKYYNINKSSASYNLMAMNETSRYAETVVDAVNAAKDDYDFSKIDDVLVVMPSTAKAIDLGSMGTQIKVGDKTIYQAINAAYINPSTKERVKPLFLTHEIGHNLGLLHPLRQDKGYVWNVMFWEQVPAADFFGWEKYKLSWINQNQVDCLSTVPSTPVIDYLEATEIASSNSKLAVIKLSDSKVLVVESRRNAGNDSLEPNEEGVLVYVVDSNLKSNMGSIRLVTNGVRTHNYNGNQLLVANLRAGETTVAEGVKVSVLKQAKSGDFVSISKP